MRVGCGSIRGNPIAARIESVTDGGKSVVVIVQILHDGVRPITGWEA